MIDIRNSMLRLAAGLLLVLAAMTVRAADPAEDRWQFISAPHLWAAGIDGDVTIKGMTADVDIGFDEIRDHMSGGFMTYLELRKRKFGFYANPLWLKLTGDGSTSRGRSFRFEQQLWIVEFGAFYNLAQWGQDKPLALDVIGGARYWNNHMELKLSGPLIDRVSSASTKDLIDPIIGLRANQRLTQKFSWSLRGDIGGFGISNNSTDFSWQAMGLLGYDLSRRCSLWGGYRALAYDKEDGSGANKHGADVVLHGPILGLEIRF
jgi:hypothetical protein